MKIYAIGIESEAIIDLYKNKEDAITSFKNCAIDDKVSETEITKALTNFEKYGYGFANMKNENKKMGWEIAEYNVIE